MNDLWKTLAATWNEMRSGIVPQPSIGSIPPNRCQPPETAGYPIPRDKMYFTIRVNELHLAENRDWWSVFDPMIFIVTEFNYGYDRVAVPMAVGPGLIQKFGVCGQPMHGVVLEDITVAGPYPYRGGNVDITAGLYRLKRTDHARVLLKAADALTASLGVPAEMATISKVGGAILGIVEGLLGLEETTYLAGYRTSMVRSSLDQFKAGFSVLLSPPLPRDAEALMVKDHRLHIENGNSITPYRASDFALLSVSGQSTRDDINILPFYRLKDEGITSLADGADGIKRGKANLIAAYQQMRKSGDVTESEAGQIFDRWLNEFAVEKARLERTRSLPIGDHALPRSLLADDLDSAVKRLEL